jgi:PAS domain-containing protein
MQVSKTPYFQQQTTIVVKINSDFKILGIWPEKNFLSNTPLNKNKKFSSFINKNSKSTFEEFIKSAINKKASTKEIHVLLKGYQQKEKWFLVNVSSEKNKETYLLYLTNIHSVKINLIKKENEVISKNKLYESLLNHLPIAATYKNIQGDFFLINKSFTQLLGFTIKDIPTVEDWIKKSIKDPHTLKTALQYWHKDFATLKKGGRIRDKILHVNTKNGEAKVLELNALLHDTFILTTYNDVTDKYKNTLALTKEKENFQKFVEYLPFPFASCNYSFELTYINKKFRETYGYSFEEIKNYSTWFNKFKWDYEGQDKEHDNQFYQTLALHTANPDAPIPFIERKIYAKDKNIKNIAIHFGILQDQMFGIIIDITEQKKEESLLIESEHRFKSLAENMPIAIGSHDFAGNVVFINKHFIKTIGYGYKELRTLKDWYKLSQPN